MSESVDRVFNGSTLYLICGIVILYVTVQALLFMRIAWRRGTELGLAGKTMRQAVTNSAVFSIIPSLPIVLMLMVLTQVIGRYFSWLRLSVIGSASYENMSIDIAAKSYGLTGISDPGFSPEIYVAATWIMTFGIVWGILFNIFFMETLDKQAKNIQIRGGGFMKTISAALFIGMLSVMSMPYLTNAAKNSLGTLSFCAAAAVSLLIGAVSQKINIGPFKEFAFPISLLAGMFAAILAAPLF
ncbi:MAG: DUF5058 family protein [Synergistaceae bacterium]|jgi:hypothetical protein|nr:DUF5058 family protein [Synergistaceae bacterium]